MFRSSMSNKISFEPVREDDLEMIHRWLISDHVFEYYRDKDTKPSLDEVRDKYVPAINGKVPIQRFLIVIDGTPVGQIQMYKIDDHPGYKNALQITEHAAGVDIFIGDSSYLHKGWGCKILTVFLERYVFALLNVESCIVGPKPSNAAAIKAYRKVGFLYFKTVLVDAEEEYLMRITKKDLEKKNSKA